MVREPLEPNLMSHNVCLGPHATHGQPVIYQRSQDIQLIRSRQSTQVIPGAGTPRIVAQVLPYVNRL